MYLVAVLTATFIWYHFINHLSTLFLSFFNFIRVDLSCYIRVGFCFLLSVWDNFVMIPPGNRSVNTYFVIFSYFLHNWFNLLILLYSTVFFSPIQCILSIVPLFTTYFILLWNQLLIFNHIVITGCILNYVYFFKIWDKLLYLLSFLRSLYCS